VRYNASKERSIELLRQAVGEMSRHPAALNPHAFAVWYEHFAACNGSLSRAIEMLLQRRMLLDDGDIERLHHEHVHSAEDRAMRTASGNLERVMSQMSQSAATTGERATNFGDALAGLQETLRSDPTNSLAPTIDRLRGNANEMRDSVAELQRQISAGRQEIERLRKDLDVARDQALLDPLTGVFNRKGFDLKLQALLQEPQRSEGPHCLTMFDIDHFKAVNDNYGHVMGDRVIQAVADVLRKTLPDPAHAVGRFGGEEFAVVMPRTAPDVAATVAQSCLDNVRRLKIRDRRTQDVVLAVTISGGVAALRPHDDAASLIAAADAAMYSAKQGGRDRVAVA
jgi:diguanylate cyclase